MSDAPTDPRVSGPWQMVICGDCRRVYQCTPTDDHYLDADDPEGSPRVCSRCLFARHKAKQALPQDTEH